ncbi:MAG: HNH endonuclease [Acidobacteriota bacterium]|nr:HNH endonuclease [Acidobacteriota bacterium]
MARGFCRVCYDRRRRSQIFFAGHREAVLRRDGCCQTCLAEEQLVLRALIVHHRRPGCNQPAVHITLCRGCHARVHRRQQLPGFYSELFFRLWREVHPGAPAQLRLPLAA